MVAASIWICCVVLILSDVCHISESRILRQNNRKLFISKNMTRTKYVDNFYNVISPTGADPWVYQHTDGWYYMTRTTGGYVRIWRSRTFTSFGASESKTIWTSPNTGPACRDVWAPEIHYIKSAWYAYFAASTCDRNNDNHRMFVLENTNPDPFNGSFTFKGQITDSTDKWAIDGTVFEHPRTGQLYYIWSGWEGDVNVRQILYIATLSNPWTVDSKRVEISRPTYKWETNHFPHVNEGPQITIRDETILLIYSASGSWTDDYCLGLITAPLNCDLMNATSWTKRPDPIFKSANDIFGPGHHSITKSPDGKEDWIIYHSARFKGSGWTRLVRAQKFTWNADSTPNLGEPVNQSIPIRIPSGDPFRRRFTAQRSRRLNRTRAVSVTTRLTTAMVNSTDSENSTVQFNVQCTVNGSHVIIIRDSKGSSLNTTAAQQVSINGQGEMPITIIYGGLDIWGATMMRANLTQGVNTLTFRKGEDLADIDELDVFPDGQQ